MPKRRRNTTTTNSDGPHQPRRLRSQTHDVPLPPLYSPLPADHIRVLYLEDLCIVDAPSKPGGKDFAVECRLESISLQDVESARISYTALSYCWGPGEPAFCQLVKCNGHLVDVTLNLFHALKQLVFDTSIEALWVDALCINQTDAAEKSIQINLMGSIYSQAEQVVAWVCPGSQDHNTDGLSQFWDWHGDESPNKPPLPHSISEIGRSFLNHCEWGRRRWTLQEACLAKQIRVQCGPFHVDWASLLTIRSSLVDTIETLRSKEGEHSLIFLLEASGQRRSARPEDAIYSLLGMYQDSALLRSDQTFTTQEIFRRATFIVLQETGNLNLVMSSAKIFFRASGKDWVFFERETSWIVDWSRARSPVSLPSYVWSSIVLSSEDRFSKMLMVGQYLLTPGLIVGYCKPAARLADVEVQILPPWLATTPSSGSAKDLDTFLADPPREYMEALPAPVDLRCSRGAYSSNKVFKALREYHNRAEALERKDREAGLEPHDAAEVQQSTTWFFVCKLFNIDRFVLLGLDPDYDGEHARCRLAGKGHYRFAHRGSIPWGKSSLFRTNWLPSHFLLM